MIVSMIHFDWTICRRENDTWSTLANLLMNPFDLLHYYQLPLRRDNPAVPCSHPLPQTIPYSSTVSHYTANSCQQSRSNYLYGCR